MKSILIMALIALPSMVMAQSSFNIESKSATVDFLMVGDKTKGTFSDVSANVVISSKDLSAGTVTGKVKVSTINTGNKSRDKHLLSGDFFEAEKYPVISFSTGVISETKAGFNVQGELTMKGITKEVSFMAVKIGEEVHFKTTIYASDFNVLKKSRDDTKVEINVRVPVG